MNPNDPRDWLLKTVLIRYPDPAGDPSEADVLQALAAAEFFRNFAKNILGI